MTTPFVLILYYSRYGATAKMAQAIARGIEQAQLQNFSIEARLRTVPAVSPNNEASEPAIPTEGAVYCTEEDLRDCSGIILGNYLSPVTIVDSVFCFCGPFLPCCPSALVLAAAVLSSLAK